MTLPPVNSTELPETEIVTSLNWTVWEVPLTTTSKEPFIVAVKSTLDELPLSEIVPEKASVRVPLLVVLIVHSPSEALIVALSAQSVKSKLNEPLKSTGGVDGSEMVMDPPKLALPPEQTPVRVVVGIVDVVVASLTAVRALCATKAGAPDELEFAASRDATTAEPAATAVDVLPPEGVEELPPLPLLPQPTVAPKDSAVSAVPSTRMPIRLLNSRFMIILLLVNRGQPPWPPLWLKLRIFKIHRKRFRAMTSL